MDDAGRQEEEHRPVALHRLSLAIELLKTTKEKKFADWIISQSNAIVANVNRVGWMVAPVLSQLNNKKFSSDFKLAVKNFHDQVSAQEKKNPYGMPYEPDIWGAGWGIQSLGVQYYFLYKAFPDIFPNTYMLHSMNLILGCHP